MLGSVRDGVEVFSGSFYGPPQGQRHPHKDVPFSDSGNLKQKDRPKAISMSTHEKGLRSGDAQGLGSVPCVVAAAQEPVSLARIKFPH